MNIVRQVLNGAKIEEHLEAIAKLRIDIFSEYPYLYKGDASYEKKYVQTYAESKQSVVIVALAGSALAGAMTGIPLLGEMDELKTPFVSGQFPLESIYYVGELLFYPAYRDKGIGSVMLKQLEDYVRKIGGFRYLTCATVIRSDNHPMRPENFKPIDRFLNHVNFAKLEGVTASLAWPGLDGKTRHHDLRFWMKSLD
ncbi:MAG: GNAT family N-acetyltransferase [Desulfuromonas sp.]|nr:GNAT family N-acetyltransferase [Desulfuromonas sp.]